MITFCGWQFIKPFFVKVFYLVWFFLNLPCLLASRVRFSWDLQLNGFLFVKNNGNFYIARGVRINSSPTSNPIGSGSRSFFQILKGGSLSIHSSSRISNVAITAANSVTIGRNVFIGSGVAIFDTDFHPLHYCNRCNPASLVTIKSKPISIHDNCFIGARSIILKGVTIGFGAVVGAGSVVTRDIPPLEIWAGNPARLVAKLGQTSN